jgi:hypothetical protein
MVETETLPVSKKRSESRRFNTLVRLDDGLVERAKKVAALRGITLGDYLTDTLRPIVDRDLSKEAKKLAKEEGPEG